MFLLIVGVAGHVDVEVGEGLARCGIQLAAIKEQRLQTPTALQLALEQRLIQRLKIGPLGCIKLGRYEIGSRECRHGVGLWLLVIGYWLLVIGGQLSVVGLRMFYPAVTCDAIVRLVDRRQCRRLEPDAGLPGFFF